MLVPMANLLQIQQALYVLKICRDRFWIFLPVRAWYKFPHPQDTDAWNQAAVMQYVATDGG
jgi:hypothetical protein